MITREQLKQKYEAIHEHFNFKDFLGLSALIFGLVVSNSSMEPTQTNQVIKNNNAVEKNKKIESKKVKKVSQKKVLKKPKKKRQQVTASHK